MGEPTNQEIKDLILLLEKAVLNLDKRMDVQFVELKGDMKALDGKIKQSEERLTGEIKRLEGEIKQSEERLTGEIKRLEGEIKQSEERLTGEIKRVDEKLSGLDKRLSHEASISRTAFAALVVGAMAGLIKYLFFPQGA